MTLLLAVVWLFLLLIHVRLSYVLPLMVLVAYVLMLSVISFDLTLPNWSSIPLGVLQRPPLRNLMTTTFFLLSMLTFVLATQVRDCETTVSNLFNWYLKFATYAAIFALFQVIVNIYSEALNGFFLLFSKGVILEGSGLIRLRPSPFVYEPRYFAIAMGIGLFVLLLKEKVYLVPMRFKERIATILLFLSLIMFAASTSAIAAIGAGFGVFLLSRLKRRGGMRVVIVVAVTGTGVYFAVESLHLLVVDRFILYLNRAGIAATSGDGMAQLAVLAYADWLRAIPIQELLVGKGLGNSAYFALDYLAASSMLSEKGFFSARVNILDMIGDIGLIGFMYIHFLWFYLLQKLRESRLAEAQRPRLRMLKSFGYFLIGLNLLFKVDTLIWLILGLCWRCYHQRTPVAAGTQMAGAEGVS